MKPRIFDDDNATAPELTAIVYGGIIKRSFTAALVLGLLAAVFSPPGAAADGCFVVPPFVWDKHRDINEPTQKAILIYDGGVEDLILQVKYDGPVEQFGWLVPVPGLPTVQKGSMQSFYALSRYTQENWEPRTYSGSDGNMEAVASLSARGPHEPEPVKVVEVKTIGAYEVAVLSASEPGSLEKWLAANQFSFPQDKAEVIDSYVKQHWYFVAVKIDLRKTSGFQLVNAPRQATASKSGLSVAEKLAAGELQPLQITFASDECVFPLKISSVNGTPSEVQVYVLSPEPLVERRMFEKKFPEVKKLALQQNEQRIRMQKQNQKMRQAMRLRFNPGLAGSPIPQPVIETNLPLDQILRSSVPYDLLPHYGAVTEKDVPGSELPRFRGKTWWLTKQTWTFQPDEMQDLVFQPAAAVFAEDLDNEMGYYAAQNLVRLGSAAVPALLSALQSSNSVVRIYAASALDENYADSPPTRDPRVGNYLPALFHDPEAEVRMDAAEAAGEAWDSKFAEPLIQLLGDDNQAVQGAAEFALRRNPRGLRDHVAELQKLFQDENLTNRVDALELLEEAQAVIPREQLLVLLTVPDMRTLSLALRPLEQDGVTDDELLPLLHSSYMPARLAWLRAVRDFQEKTAVEAVITLLRDPELIVRRQAWELLKELTNQEIPQDQPDQWEQWWLGNKTSFMIAAYSGFLKENPTAGATYHDRGCLYYDTRAFTNALADFRKAGELGSDIQDYSFYRIWLIRARMGETEAATRELTAYLQHRPTGKTWPLQVGRFLTGQTNEADFIRTADDSNGQTDREQRCEAWFYAGMKHLIAGDAATATVDFQKCLATHVESFEEYQSAQAELQFLAGAAGGAK